MGRFFHIGSLNFKKGFTIVELLIVVVVIGILAAITIVSFGGVTSQANVASLQSDLDNNSKKLQLYFTQYGSYPTALDGSNCPSSPTADTNYCLKATTGSTITYQYDPADTSDFSLYITKGTTVGKVKSSMVPTVTKLSTPCPSGFIVVPGSSTYNTSDFCIMKYEAKCALTASPTVGLTSPSTTENTYANNTTACTSANSRGVVSTASGYSIANIDQSTSSTYSTNTIGCTGCTLMTEAQWMTLTQNVLTVASNWSGNTVGSGYIYNGHTDNSPAGALVASVDSNGYFGTNDTSPSRSKRTLTLTNGEVIWDMAGNVKEWTSAQITGGQPTGTPNSTREWTAVSGGTFSVNPYPSGTGISGAGSWTSTNGIGMISSDSADNTLRGFVRSGDIYGNTAAGVLSLDLTRAPTITFSNFGFRVSRQ